MVVQHKLSSEGELILENNAGDIVSATDYDTAALLAVNFNGRFWAQQKFGKRKN